LCHPISSSRDEVGFYEIVPNLFMTKNLTKSFSRRHVRNEYTRTVKSAKGVIEAKPGIPKTEISDTMIELTTIATRRGLLGMDFQKCFRSLTVITVKYPAKTSVSPCKDEGKNHEDQTKLYRQTTT